MEQIFGFLYTGRFVYRPHSQSTHSHPMGTTLILNSAAMITLYAGLPARLSPPSPHHNSSAQVLISRKNMPAAIVIRLTTPISPTSTVGNRTLSTPHGLGITSTSVGSYVLQPQVNFARLLCCIATPVHSGGGKRGPYFCARKIRYSFSPGLS